MIGAVAAVASAYFRSGAGTAAAMTPDNTYSGQVAFDFQKAFSPIYKKPWIDLEEPYQLAAVVGLVVLGAVIWLKRKK